MPKKPNSHGNDQEYVPAGNGDASGEYADEQGGNRHFESFKKPESNRPQKTSQPKVANSVEIGVGIQGVVVEPNTTREKYEGFDDYLKKYKGGKNFKPENLKESFEAGSPESKACLDHFIASGDITYKSGSSSMYSPGAKLVEMNKNNDDVFVGESFYHESGHAVDYALGEDMQVQTYFLSRTVRKPMSETKITSNGKTLLDTLSEEMRTMDWQAVVADYQTAKKENPVEYPADYSEKRKAYQDATNGLYKKASDEAGRIASEKYSVWDRRWSREYHRQYEIQKQTLMSDEAKRLKAELDKIEVEHTLAERRVKSPYDTLSDMYGAQKRVSYGFAGCGHSATYYRDRPEGKAHEFFAEYFSARSIGDKETIEKLNQFMPQSSKACEELYQFAISQR